MISSSRRRFLRTTLTATATAAILGSAGSMALGLGATRGTDPGPIDHFDVSVTNNLHDAPVFTQLKSGAMSDALLLSGNETYRVRVSETGRVTVFGPMYNVELLKPDGSALESMLAGRTATFRRYGVQISVAAVTPTETAARAIGRH